MHTITINLWITLETLSKIEMNTKRNVFFQHCIFTVTYFKYDTHLQDFFIPQYDPNRLSPNPKLGLITTAIILS